MRTALFAVLLVPALAHAAGNRIQCHDVVEGPEVGGRFESTVTFDSSVPTFVDVLKITLTGQAPEESKSTHLAADAACGVPLDFATRCKASEKFSTKLGYAYSFTCGTDITFAEIYCDENCLSSAGSGATLRCQGPKVAKKYTGGGLTFQGCKFTKAE